MKSPSREDFLDTDPYGDKETEREEERDKRDFRDDNEYIDCKEG